MVGFSDYARNVRSQLQQKIKDPEVIVIRYHSTSSSRLDPCRPAIRHLLAAHDARSLITFVKLGLRAHHQPVVPDNASGSCLASDFFFGFFSTSGLHLTLTDPPSICETEPAKAQ